MKKPKTSKQNPNSPFRSFWFAAPQGYRVVESLVPDPSLYRWDISMGSKNIVEWDTLPKVGYEDKIVKSGPWLIENRRNSALEPAFEYNPMRAPLLHRKFAEIEPTGESVASFAAEHGFLGRVISYERDVTGACESIPFWWMHVGRVRMLLKLWDACRDPKTVEEAEEVVKPLMDRGDFASLSQEGQQDLQAFPPYPYPSETEASSYVAWESLGPFDEMSPEFQFRNVGLLLLREELNRELEQGVRAAVNPTSQAFIHLVPRDLLGAIYAKFALETIEGSLPTQKCVGCGKWFAPNNARQKACNPTCRKRANRRYNGSTAGATIGNGGLNDAQKES